MGTQNLIKILDQGVSRWNTWRQRNPSHPINLDRLDLRNRNLEGIDWFGASLISADLSNCNLTDADLRSANLTQANLLNATLTRASLSGLACLSQGIPDRADLSHANLTLCNADFVSFEGACLRSIRGAGLKLHSSNLDHACFDHANLVKANLAYASMQQASLIRANLSDSYMWHIKAYKSNWQFAQLSHSWIYHSNFSKANLANTDLKETHARYVNFDHANLNNANLTQTWIEHASLRFATLHNAHLACGNYENARFDHADLTDVRHWRCVIFPEALRDAQSDRCYDLSNSGLEITTKQGHCNALYTLYHQNLDLFALSNLVGDLPHPNSPKLQRLHKPQSLSTEDKPDKPTNLL